MYSDTLEYDFPVQPAIPCFSTNDVKFCPHGILKYEGDGHRECPPARQPVALAPVAGEGQQAQRVAGGMR